MFIALTYDLRSDYLALGYSDEETAEFDRESTIDSLEGALRSLGHRTERVGNVFALVDRLAAGERWDLVFNIAEGMFGFAREAAIPALLEAWQIPCTFSDGLVCAIGLQKAVTKRVLRDAGVATPEFWVVESLADLAQVPDGSVLFAKPIAEGTSKGVGADARIETRAQLESVCRRLLDKFREPVLVERFLPGREVTVGVLGTGAKARTVAALEVILKDAAEPLVYTYKNKEECEELVEYRLADDAFARASEELALRAWRALGARDAGRVDLRANAAGGPEVIEINPLPGMHPEHSDLPILAGLAGMEYRALVEAIVASASERVVARPRLRLPTPRRAASDACGS